MLQPEPRRCFKCLIDAGWTDALRTLHPDKPMYTFWHYLRNCWPRDAGLRIDHLLLNGPATALSRLAAVFDDSVDVVLLVHRTFQVHAETGFGDFAVDQLGNPRRRREREIVPYIFAGASLMRATLIDGMPDGAFSLNRAWDRAIQQRRIRAVVHDGIWFHLSTPSDLIEAEQVLEARVTGDVRWPWR